MLIQGTAGPDSLNGTSQADTIEGFAGNDSLNGRGGPDALYGGTGNDTLDGGLGADTLDGSAGNDTAEFLWDNYFSWNTFGDMFWHSDLGANVTATLSNNGNGTMRIRGSAPSFYSGSDENVDIIHSLAGIENLTTGHGNDRLSGNDSANILSSGWGDDILLGGRGNDTLLGGEGNDTLQGGGGRDILNGGAGLDVADYSDNTVNIKADLVADRIDFPGRNWSPEFLTLIEGVITGSGNDTLTGDNAANYLAGGGGADSLLGNGGNDTLDGGLGTDTLSGGSGSDTVEYSSITQAVRVRIGAQLAEVYTSGGQRLETDQLQSIENATGGRGNDTLLGTNALNILDGGDGNDNLQARENNDTLVLSSGNDTLDGGTGTDTLLIDHRESLLASTIYIADAYEIGSLNERLNFTYDVAVTVNLSAGTAKGSADYTGTTSLSGIENVRILGAWGDDTVTGSDAANIIHVGAGANVVEGRGGNDTIYGGNYNPESFPLPQSWYGEISMPRGSVAETLSGGSGNDLIYGSGRMNGGQGNDRLISTQYFGEVSMIGGAGADRFEFNGQTYFLPSYNPGGYTMKGRIVDFSPTEGDKLVIQSAFGSESYPLTYRGEVGEQEDIGLNEYGYTRHSSSLSVYYGSNDYAWTDGDNYALTITLADYTGPLTQDDFIFV